jgi:hypothetical protein
VTQLPKVPKMSKMPKIKDVNHLIEKKSQFQNTSMLKDKRDFNPIPACLP